MKTDIIGTPKETGTEALHIGAVSKRSEWLEQQMNDTPPFKQAYKKFFEKRLSNMSDQELRHYIEKKCGLI